MTSRILHGPLGETLQPHAEQISGQPHKSGRTTFLESQPIRVRLAAAAIGATRLCFAMAIAPATPTSIDPIICHMIICSSQSNYDYTTANRILRRCFRSIVPDPLIFNLTVLEVNLPVRTLQAPKLVVIILKAFFDSLLVFKPGDFKIVISCVPAPARSVKTG